jgi:8-oxo-dGTP diphosphatase
MKNNRQVYVKFGRLISPIALLGLRLVTKITGLPRVRVIVVNERNEILLVRGIISHLGHWMLPGGGVNRHEQITHAVQRELYEETGVMRPVADFHYIRTIAKSELGLGYNAPLFSIAIKKDEVPKILHNPSEIAEIGWFKFGKLPSELSKLADYAIEEYRSSTAG